MVGIDTRHATPYGQKDHRELVAGLLELDCLIVSGLAYGIDIAAHKAALDNGLQTIGVVAHGLDQGCIRRCIRRWPGRWKKMVGC